MREGRADAEAGLAGSSRRPRAPRAADPARGPITSSARRASALARIGCCGAERHQRASDAAELRHRQRLGQHERDGVGEQPAVSGTARSSSLLGRGTGIPWPQRHAALTERERRSARRAAFRASDSARTARRAGRSARPARSIARAPRRRGLRAPTSARTAERAEDEINRDRELRRFARGLEVAERQQRLGRDRPAAQRRDTGAEHLRASREQRPRAEQLVTAPAARNTSLAC